MNKILTHPLIKNYGGFLQAFSLQHALKKIGKKNYIIDFIPQDIKNIIQSHNKLYKTKSYIKLILIIFFRLPFTLPILFYPYIFRKFKKKFFNLWDLKKKNISVLIKSENSFIVGSDQVWRCIYTRNIESVPFFFLNFATKKQRNNSISYAASFGSDEWEGTEEETKECAKLLKEFKAVSVREHSGIRICKDIFGVDAVQMPDPTLLLEQDDYNYLIKHWRTKSLPKPFMSIYILDETPNNQSLADSLCNQLNLYPQQLMPHLGAKKLIDRLPLSVPQWLRCIRDCEYVLTDSFHGCAFSIIFNKPFICLGNEARGTARFDSLLNTFGLQERIVKNPTPEILTTLINTPIDWDNVNSIRRSEQQRAFEFLRANLT